MKKVLALVLAMSMALSLFACGSSSEDKPSDAGNADPAQSADAQPNESGNSGDKKGVIGYNYFAAGDYALDTLANNTKRVIEACGYEAMGVCDNGSLDQLVTDVENMISAGVDGLVLWMPNDSLYLKVAQLCENAGVPFCLSDKVPTDKSITEQLESFKTYVGGVTPDNHSYGVQMGQFALDQGYKSCFILASGVGDASGTPRIDGFTEVFEAGGGKILGTQHTDDSNQAVTQAEDMYLAHTDADFIMATGASTFGTAGLEALKKYNDTRMKIVTADFDESILASMKESDTVSFLIGDFLVCGSYASVLMCNYLNGTPITDPDGSAPYIDVVPAFSIPVEQQDLFAKYVAGDCIYSAEESQAMMGLTLDQFVNDIVLKFDSLESRLRAKYEQGIISAEEMQAAGLTVE